MDPSVVKKLRLHQARKALILQAPEGYLRDTSALPKGIVLDTEPNGKYDFVHVFVRSVAELNELAPKAIASVENDGLLWISYPKKSSKIKTDITRDVGWDAVVEAGLEGVSLVAIDETWSSLRFRPVSAIKRMTRKKTIGVKKEQNELEEKGASLSVELPSEWIAALETEPSASAFFSSLAPSHKKAYIDWIASAKREETRKRRIAQAIEKLLQGQKGPYSK